MKKVLIFASVASMIQQFNMNNIDLLIELGFKVDIACNLEFGSNISDEKIKQLKEMLTEQGVSFYHLPIPRKLKDVKNLIKSYLQTKQLLNKNTYDLIHCHSPIGGLLCRIANKKSNNYFNSKMIYTAHGFHFFKGNNIIKNLVYKSVEKYAAKYTDVLITINKEDFEAAKKFTLKKGGVVKKVPGVGIDLEKIKSIKGDRKKLLREFQIPSNSLLLVSVGELNDNKNHILMMEALKRLPETVHYLICGIGSLKERYEKFVEENELQGRVHLLGYRQDIINILKSCDIFIFLSKREGLPVALMEALASGLPCIASNIRGNSDLITNNQNGYLVDLTIEDCVKAIKAVRVNQKEVLIDNNKYLIMYDCNNIAKKMKEIYELVMKSK